MELGTLVYIYMPFTQHVFFCFSTLYIHGSVCWLTITACVFYLRTSLTSLLPSISSPLQPLHPPSLPLSLPSSPPSLSHFPGTQRYSGGHRAGGGVGTGPEGIPSGWWDHTGREGQDWTHSVLHLSSKDRCK